jgi:signal transduction histidine kinase
MSPLLLYLLLALLLVIVLFLGYRFRQCQQENAELRHQNAQLLKVSEEDRLNFQAIHQRITVLQSFDRVLIRLAKNKYVQLGDWERALIQITEVAANALQVSRLSIWQYNENPTNITCLDLYEADKDKHSKGLLLPKEAYPNYFRFIEQEEVLVASEAAKHEGTQEFAKSYLVNHQVAAMLDVPYFIDTRLSGIICCEHHSPRPWQAEEIQFVKSLAYVVAIAFKSFRRKQAEEEIEEKNSMLEQQNEEIRSQHQLLEEQHEEIARMNTELQRLNDELEEIVKERTESLIMANKQLEIAYQELDLFTYRASHDFRGPITTLMGLINIGQLESRDPLINSLFDKIKYTARRMDNMLTKLLMVHDINYKPTNIGRVNIQEVLEDVQNALLSFIKEHQVTLHLNIDSDTVLFTDQDLMNIILMNLAENAIFYRSHRSPEIHLFFKNHQKFIEITVSDNGVGVSEEMKEKVFDMFYRGSNVSNGSGLGLYVVKKAVEKLKGTIQVESLLHEYTTFRIQIPTLVESPAS